MNNSMIINNMMNQCVYSNAEVGGTCPPWLWVVLGVVVVGLIGFLVWVAKKD